MVRNASRYFVRFAVHLTSTYRENYLSEIAENTHAESRELPDGRTEIKGFLPREASEVLDALQQEQARGSLTIEEFS